MYMGKGVDTARIRRDAHDFFYFYIFNRLQFLTLELMQTKLQKINFTISQFSNKKELQNNCLNWPLFKNVVTLFTHIWQIVKNLFFVLNWSSYHYIILILKATILNFFSHPLLFRLFFYNFVYSNTFLIFL